jgi:hypothetical protein
MHMNPPGHGDVNTERKMHPLAISERRKIIMWGVVNPGNALCFAVFWTKREAERCRREKASAYVVVRVVVSPLYTQEPEKRAAEEAYCSGESSERPENGMWPNRYGREEPTCGK